MIEKDGIAGQSSLAEILIQESPDAYLALSPTGAILFWNRGAENIFGYKAEEALGRHLDQLIVPPDRVEEAHGIFQRALKEDLVLFQSVRRRKNGTYLHVAVSKRRVLNEKGEIDFIAVSKKDITQLKSLQESNRAQELLREAREQLRHSQKMDAVGQLAGGIAHDFNNILGIISGCSEFLLDDIPEGDRKRKDVLQIREATDKAARLVQQLLAFARKQHTRTQVVDINSLIEKFGSFLSRTMPSNILIEHNLRPSVGCVQADPSELEQIIMNLALNARDAMPEGGTLRIETQALVSDGLDHPDVQPGPYVVLTVSDTGEGMVPEIRERIFEPFFTTKPQGQGTGLGLATVYSILKSTGGSVSVESEPGEGAKFKVLIPAVAGDADVARQPGTDVRADAVMRTILVAEDDPAVRNIASRILKKGGYHVLESGSGQEALAIATAHSGEIHLLLSDIMMPGMNGPDLARKLREKFPRVKVLFMSGYASMKTRAGHEQIDSLLHELIQKPFTRDALLGKVAETLESKS
jgi:PAS domain S-box-containing protein